MAVVGGGDAERAEPAPEPSMPQPSIVDNQKACNPPRLGMFATASSFRDSRIVHF
jgi:hypothetical protein